MSAALGFSGAFVEGALAEGAADAVTSGVAGAAALDSAGAGALVAGSVEADVPLEQAVASRAVPARARARRLRIPRR